MSVGPPAGKPTITRTAATDRLAPLLSATAPSTRQRPRPDAENFGGEVSSSPLRLAKVIQSTSSAWQVAVSYVCALPGRRTCKSRAFARLAHRATAGTRGSPRLPIFCARRSIGSTTTEAISEKAGFVAVTKLVFVTGFRRGTQLCDCRWPERRRGPDANVRLQLRRDFGSEGF